MCIYEKIIFVCGHEYKKERIAYCERALEAVPRYACPLETKLEIRHSGARCTGCFAAAAAKKLQEYEDNKTPWPWAHESAEENE